MLNQAQIIGRLGRDPEVRYTQSGDPVTTLSVATTSRWKDKKTGEQKEATEWHRVTAFGALATIMDQLLKKGSLVFVQGKIVTRKYTGQDGIERYVTEIRADEMKILSGGKDNTGTAGNEQHAQAQRQQQPMQPQCGDAYEGDIPF